jgi:hypothetical protein
MLDLAADGASRLIALQKRVIAEDIEAVDERW